jgi:hypothetical protein
MSAVQLTGGAAWYKFSEVSALIYLPYKATMEVGQLRISSGPGFRLEFRASFGV